MILCVCTGNICRSPAAERLLARRLGGQLSVASAGTAALVGEPIAAPMARLIETAGADATSFAARRLTSQQLRDSALVLTMTREQRAVAVDLWPGVVRRSFTLREFARLCSAIPWAQRPTGAQVDRLPEVVTLAAAQRRPSGPNAPVDDIADPYRRDASAYQTAFEQIAAAVGVLEHVLVGEAARPG